VSLVTIDRSGSMEHQAGMMLQLLEYLVQGKNVEVRIFDTSRERKRATETYDVMLRSPACQPNSNSAH